MRKPIYPAFMYGHNVYYDDIVSKLGEHKVWFDIRNIYFDSEEEVDFEVYIYIDNTYICSLNSDNLDPDIYDILREELVKELWRSE